MHERVPYGMCPLDDGRPPDRPKNGRRTDRFKNDKASKQIMFLAEHIFFKVQVRIHFDALYVRYLWPLVLPQYSPPESRPTLHNPLGLSQGLKSSSTSPQNGMKAAAIAMQFNPKMGIMRQSPSRRTQYVFYRKKMSDIESPQNSRKISQHTQFSYTKFLCTMY